MDGTMDANQRYQERFLLDCEIRALCNESGLHLGDLMNISMKGMQLLSSKPAEMNLNYQVSLRKCDDLHYQEIQLTASPVWIKKSQLDGFFSTGWEFSSPIQDYEREFHQWINEHLFV